MPQTMRSTNQAILLVEDSVEDFETAVRAFKKSHVTNPVFHCKDGEEALDFLFRRGQYTDPASAPRPGTILLDLNMPGTDGREVLAEIKKDPTLRKIPVIILTTSLDERDIETCYEVGANSYVKKPVDFVGFVEAVQRLRDFWWEIVILPRPEACL